MANGGRVTGNLTKPNGKIVMVQLLKPQAI